MYCGMNVNTFVGEIQKQGRRKQRAVLVFGILLRIENVSYCTGVQVTLLSVVVQV